ncbi:polymerase delta-interacting protein 3-like isoform X2 [Neocloeon triangulifer]|uniref:polymerase delta-interacting protein 3-like isoform X2 n=1 Tax=Neocloeon triangulifer TaxID=2078957 RepID=UPI00286F892A|nr:polymerase delta-interacting protein 3-like isoform X2 [Neocloeon triangulifer]
MNQTLDDIIKNRRLVSKAGGVRTKFNTFRSTASVGGGLVTKKAGRLGIAKPAPTMASRLGDARMKIIAKKRQNLVDARDQLNEIARQSDARDKLTMIRAKKQADKPKSLFTKALGGLKSGGAGKGRVGFVTKRQQVKPAKAVPLAALTRTVYQDPAPRNYLQIGRLGRAQPLHDIDVDVYNDLDAVERRSPPRRRERMPDYEELLAMYARNKLQRNVPEPVARRPAAPSQPIYRKTSSSMRMDQYYKEESEEEEVDEMEYEDDGPPQPTKFMGRTIQTKAHPTTNMFRRVQSSNVAPPRAYKKPPGHKVRVSNLAPSVTRDDIMELFSDPGELNSWEIYPGGIAEVYYKERDDAIHAVDSYHKRLLDGKPMTVTFVE